MIDWKTIPSRVNTYATVVLALSLGAVFTMATVAGVYSAYLLFRWAVTFIHRVLVG
jgi:hypothetical protein